MESYSSHKMLEPEKLMTREYSNKQVVDRNVLSFVMLHFLFNYENEK